MGMCVCMCMCMCVYVCVCVCMCMYVCVCMCVCEWGLGGSAILKGGGQVCVSGIWGVGVNGVVLLNEVVCAGMAGGWAPASAAATAAPPTHTCPPVPHPVTWLSAHLLLASPFPPHTHTSH